MDILNFISWIRGGRVVTTVDPNKTLLPVGLKDGRRDDEYLAGAISVADFAAQVGGLQTVAVDGVTITGDGTPGDPLVAAGGGGIGGLQGFFPVSGNVMPSIGFSSLFGTALIPDRILIYPFVPAVTFTTSALRINVTSAVSSANARILIYSNVAGTYRPNLKILETTDLDCSTTGEKSFLYSATFTKGEVYWISVYSNSNPTILHVNSANLLTLRQEQNNVMQHIEGVYSFGTAPAIYPTIVGYNNRICPNISFVIA